MNLAVVFDDVTTREAATADELGVMEAVQAVEAALTSLGHRVVRVPVGGRLRSWAQRLENAGADVVFNLCEGALGSSALEPSIAAVIELLGLPMTGSRPATLALCRRKDHVNAVLAAAGLAVPAWCVAGPGEAAPPWRRFPAIVKPAAEDASIGITQASVASDPYELRCALNEAAAHGVLLIQEYVAGRELNAGMVGDTVLPLAQIDFTHMPAGAWPIVTYRAKWETGSDEDRGTLPLCPAPLGESEADRLRQLAASAWRAVGGAGYGRVDFRIGEDGRACVLEVNPNPDLAPGAGLARMAARHGWSYSELVAAILAEAIGGPRTQGALERDGSLVVRP